MDFKALRESMVKEQLLARGISDRRVLDAFLRVPREDFVPPEYIKEAYGDYPLPIGQGQTISQPYVVATMLQEARLSPQHRVLEIGTGSGYQTALLCELARDVYSLEIEEELLNKARERLKRLSYSNCHLFLKDGFLGLPDFAPYDAIIVSAAPEEVPQSLIDQLIIGGRLVIPVGRGYQELLVIEKTPTGLSRRSLYPVRFVPLRH